jgi:hypothetical protein
MANRKKRRIPVPTQSEALSPTDKRTASSSLGEISSPPGETALPRRWSDWAPNGVTPWTVGVEEEVMLLDPTDWSLASRADAVMKQLTGELAEHTSTETHGSALELRTDPHETAHEGLAQLERLRGELAAELDTLGMKAAVAGLHPFTQWQSTKISEGDRYRFLYGSMRELARREPTFALHVHVAVPDAESAMLPTGCARTCRCCWRCRPTRPSGRDARRGWPRRARRCSRPSRGWAFRGRSTATRTT